MSYEVSFFKYLLSSDGHPFNCLQATIEIRRAKSIDRAVKAAQRRFARLHLAPRWTLYADTLEVNADGKKIAYPLLHGEPANAKSLNMARVHR